MESARGATARIVAHPFLEQANWAALLIVPWKCLDLEAPAKALLGAITKDAAFNVLTHRNRPAS
jgi:hypothetical protein